MVLIALHGDCNAITKKQNQANMQKFKDFFTPKKKKPQPLTRPMPITPSQKPAAPTPQLSPETSTAPIEQSNIPPAPPLPASMTNQPMQQSDIPTAPPLPTSMSNQPMQLKPAVMPTRKPAQGDLLDQIQQGTQLKPAQQRPQSIQPISSRDDLLQEIKNKKSLRPTPAQQPTVVQPNTPHDSLMQEIQHGKTLRTTTPNERPTFEKPQNQEGSLGAALSEAMDARRGSISDDEDFDNDSDDDDDDWD